MERRPNLSEALTRMETLAPEAAEYADLFLDMVHEYEGAYGERPEDLLKCFPQGFEDDQNEIIALLTRAIEKGSAAKSDAQAILQSLASELANSSVALWALKPVFEYFSVQVGSVSEAAQEFRPVRISLPNVLYAAHDVDKFLRACGLVPGEQTGGSHQKWFDKAGNFIKSFSVTSNKLWLKSMISDLLQNRVPVEVVAHALRELKIDFKLLEK